ncbi:hypothetical protein RA19_24815 [Leisingera sp. ANG-M1]|uniref:ABC transporter ATP-binding protein n=1 Tax=Leisingera sp. ANG-M1 TaxID=1577895 RepID=UPI00057EAFB4|nr:ABC transporter ATP-binding protein [Leisingera sp. ANG-M1]KIC07224.1 hypothetical protein RA19_24815 [Leisingera sp. ANG-M1]
MPKVKLRNLTHSYVDGDVEVNVLDNLSLDIEAGSFCAVSGPSGSGKSTLLNMIGMIDRPQKGQIVISGQDVLAMSERELVRFRGRHVGFVFQAYHLVPVLTAAENVAWPLYFQGVPRRKRLSAAREILARVGLKDQANRLPRRLSGGQQQRVAIARALVTEPDIVLADEPTANLDRQTAEEIMELAAGLNRDSGTSFVMATHDPLVLNYATRHLQILQGHLFEDKKPEHVHA